MIWIIGPIVETIIYGVIGGAAAELGRQMVENSSQPQPDQERVDWGIWLRQRMVERAEQEARAETPGDVSYTQHGGNGCYHELTP